MIFGRKKWNGKYPSQGKKVIVTTGVDTKKQVLGGKKGEVFDGNKETTQTFCVNSHVKIWRIVFDNLSTGERLYKDFSKKMGIGRTQFAEQGIVTLQVQGDEKISRRHCEIFEYKNKLCIRDLDSSNHTYLNGKVIAEANYLQSGDVIRIGDTQFSVNYSIIKNGPT